MAVCINTASNGAIPAVFWAVQFDHVALSSVLSEFECSIGSAYVLDRRGIIRGEQRCSRCLRTTGGAQRALLRSETHAIFQPFRADGDRKPVRLDYVAGSGLRLASGNGNAPARGLVTALTATNFRSLCTYASACLRCAGMRGKYKSLRACIESASRLQLAQASFLRASLRSPR
jgi:hypothetical protein